MEKPNAKTAEQYLLSGDYLWNCGVFLFRADTLLSQMQQHAPVVLDAYYNSLCCAQYRLGFVRIEREAFALAPDISIDYAVMEHTDKAVVVPCNTAWSDVGSWHSLAGSMEKDGSGNGRSCCITEDRKKQRIYEEKWW